MAGERMERRLAAILAADVAGYSRLIGRLDLAFEDLGEPALKNIARPVRVYRARSGPPASGRPAGEPAVRPFR